MDTNMSLPEHKADLIDLKNQIEAKLKALDDIKPLVIPLDGTLVTTNGRVVAFPVDKHEYEACFKADYSKFVSGWSPLRVYDCWDQNPKIWGSVNQFAIRRVIPTLKIDGKWAITNGRVFKAPSGMNSENTKIEYKDTSDIIRISDSRSTADLDIWYWPGIKAVRLTKIEPKIKIEIEFTPYLEPVSKLECGRRYLAMIKDSPDPIIFTGGSWLHVNSKIIAYRAL